MSKEERPILEAKHVTKKFPILLKIYMDYFKCKICKGFAFKNRTGNIK